MPRVPSKLLGLCGLALLSACAGVAAPPQDAGPSPYGAYLSGRVAEDAGALATAARDLLAVLRTDPADPALLDQTFIACLLAGRPEAVQIAAKVPNNPVATLLLADEAARDGDWQKAEALFARPSSDALSEYLTPLLQAWVKAGAHDTDGALALLAPTLRSGPLVAINTLQAALIADLGDRFPEAQAYYEQARQRFGGLNLSLARILANWAERQNRPDDAVDILKSLGHASPGLDLVVPGLIAARDERPVQNATDGLAEVYFSFAAQLRGQNETDVSLALTRLALALKPDFTAARLLLAEALIDAHAPNAALAALAPITARDPLAPLATLREADLEQALGDPKRAEADLRGLAAHFPTQEQPLAALGDLLRRQNDLGGAIAAYTHAIDLATPPRADDWTLYFARAVAEQQNNAWTSAEDDLQHSLALSPDQPEVLNFLGYAWADRGEHLPQARDLLARAAKLRPDDGAIIDSLGWVELRQGDVHDAVAALEKAVEMQPADAEINGHLGDAYWAAGRKLQARYQWQLALTLKPDAASVPKLKAKLQIARRETEAHGP